MYKCTNYSISILLLLVIYLVVFLFYYTGSLALLNWEFSTTKLGV